VNPYPALRIKRMRISKATLMIIWFYKYLIGERAKFFFSGSFPLVRTVARTLIEGCILKSVIFELISKEICRAEYKYVKIHPLN
jgi:hypothetical protein